MLLKIESLAAEGMQPLSCELMKYVLIALVLCSAGLAQNSASAPAAAPTSSPKQVKPKAAGKQILPDEGSVTDGTYTEKFFNLSCAVPSGWVVKTASMREGLAGQETSILLLSTFAKESPAAGEVNPSLTITAESLSAYPEVKTAADYFEALSQVVTGKGFAVLNEPAEIEIGGVTFLRGDFQKEQNGITTYQASMIAIRKDYILAITAISGNEEELTPLLNRIHVFAPPSLRKP